MPGRIRNSLHNFTFPHFLRAFHADLYHIPLNSVAWWMPQPYVVTIHDMSSCCFPRAATFAAPCTRSATAAERCAPRA